MANEMRTSCFTYTPDHHPLMDAAHRERAVDDIAQLVLGNVTLIEDFSLLILQNVPIIPPGDPSMTERYENLNGGPLDALQTRLAELLEQIYLTTDQERLNARRGAILERMVYHAVGKRRTYHGAEVLLNVKGLRRLALRGRAPNTYSVDVAACFPRDHTVEIYACKLHARHMLKDDGSDDDLRDLDALGDYFAKGHTAYTSVCCMETRDVLNLDDLYWAALEPYPHILTYPIDEVPDLMVSTSL